MPAGEFTSWLTSAEDLRFVPLFDTDSTLAVRTRQAGLSGQKRLLRRSSEMEAAMVEVVTSGLEHDDWLGVLYIMGWGTASDFKPCLLYTSPSPRD